MNERDCGKEKKPEDGEIYWRPEATDPCANEKSTRMFPKIIAFKRRHEKAMQRRRDEPERTIQAELRFLEEAAARMVEYHRQSVKIGEEPLMLMNTPETIRACLAKLRWDGL